MKPLLYKLAGVRVVKALVFLACCTWPIDTSLVYIQGLGGGREHPTSQLHYQEFSLYHLELERMRNAGSQILLVGCHIS